VNQKLTEDLKKLANSQVVEPLTKQLNVYEKKAKDLVKEFDLRSREARDKSKARLDEFFVQLKKTRTEVEAKVRTVFEEESKRLNTRVNDLLESLRTVAQVDTPKAAPAQAPKAASASKPARKKTSTRKSTKKTSSRATTQGTDVTH
jgi:hypothetical protein